MNGREVTEVKLSDIDLSDRADAEYVSKENLLINERLIHKPTIELGQLGKIAVSAFYPAATHLYSQGDVPFIRCVDCINYPVISDLQDDSFERIPKSFIDEHSSIDTVKTNDIIITKVGSPCFASIIEKDEELALSRTVMGLKDIQGINPFYLLAFLRSYYGFSQLLRQRELTIQYQLTVERVKAVKVFIPSPTFQAQIESLVKQAHVKVKESESLYAEAENLLLDELGLRSFMPSTERTAVKSFSESFLQTGRLDAEYYQPKYDELLNFLSKVTRRKGRILENLSSLSQPLRYGSSTKLEYLSEGVPFLRIADVRNYRFDKENLKYISAADAKNESYASVKKGDVIISRSGTLGLSVSIPSELEGAIFGSYFIRVRPNEKVDPDFLALYINSKIGQMQVEQLNTGGIQTNLTIPAIEALKISLPPKDSQEKFVAKVKESFATEDESKRLLETAKRAVEIAIEESEQSALKFIRAAY